jgi:hypothetical protein
MDTVPMVICGAKLYLGRLTYCGLTRRCILWRKNRGSQYSGENIKYFQRHKKTEEACASSVVKVSELRLCWTADPPRPFQFRLAPHSFRPSVASRESFSRLSFSTLARLSQETANLYRVTLLVRPLLLAEPGLGDALSTTRVLAVSSTLLSSGGSAF